MILQWLTDFISRFHDRAYLSWEERPFEQHTNRPSPIVAYYGDDGNVRLTPDGENVKLYMDPDSSSLYVLNGGQETMLKYG